MIPYISPRYSCFTLLRFLRQHNKLSDEFVSTIKRENRCTAVYVRKKARYVLAAILEDLHWKNRKIALPLYTCESLKRAIEYTGNKVVFYEVDYQLNADASQFSRIIEQDIDALLISDVYGIQVAIPEIIIKKPDILLIGDFAHHISFQNENDNRKFDVLLYSSDYYKPMTSMGVGLGLIQNIKLNLKDSLYIDRSFIASSIDLIRLWFIKVILHNFLGRIMYKASLEKENSIAPLREDLISKRPSSINLALLHTHLNYSTAKLQGNIRSYYTALSGNKKIKTIITRPGTGCTYFSVVLKDICRKELILHMLKKGILLGRIFSNIAGKKEENGASGQIAKNVVNLPVMIEEKISKKIISSILSALNEY